MIRLFLEQQGLLSYEIKNFSSIYGEWGINKLGYLFFYTEDQIPAGYLAKGTFISVYLEDNTTHRLKLARRFTLQNWTYLVRGHKSLLALFGNDIHIVLRNRIMDSERFADFSQKLLYRVMCITIGPCAESEVFRPDWQGRYVPEIFFPDHGDRYYEEYHGNYVEIYTSLDQTTWEFVTQVTQADPKIGLYISEVSNYRWLLTVDVYPWGKTLTLPYDITVLQTFDERVFYDHVATHYRNHCCLEPIFPGVRGMWRYEIYQPGSTVEAFRRQDMVDTQISLTAKGSQLNRMFLDIDVGDRLMIKSSTGEMQGLPVMGYRVSYNEEAKKSDITLFAGVKGDRGW